MKQIALPVILVLAVAATSSTTGTPLYAAAAEPSSMTVPVTGVGEGLTFVGTFTIQKFVATDSGVGAAGTLTGTATDTAGVVVTIVRNVVMPVDIGTATCEILHLELGPIFLDLLGLQVDLNQVVLDITAQAGAGNLLGNLLCAVAGLLDSPGPLANLLNQILDLLG